MREAVPVRCPVCLDESSYAAPVFPCACGSPAALPLDLTAPPVPLEHRTWSDSWVAARCGVCGLVSEWPQPEMGCGSCGTVVRIPVHPLDPVGLEEARGLLGRMRPPASPGPPGPAEASEAADRQASGFDTDFRGPGSRSADLLRPADLRSGDSRAADFRSADHRSADLQSADGRSADSRATDSRADSRAADSRAADSQAADTRAASNIPAGAPEAATAGSPNAATSPSAPGADGASAADGSLSAAHPLRATGPAGPYRPQQPGGAAPAPRAPRPPFRPMAIRTARDAVATAALYLRWLGFRDVRQPDGRPIPTAAVDLRAPGLVAQVDPTTAPAGLRAVECVWLNGLTASAAAVYFALAGYTQEARARADELRIPLFVMDLTGMPQPLNDPADALVAAGA